MKTVNGRLLQIEPHVIHDFREHVSLFRFYKWVNSSVIETASDARVNSLNAEEFHHENVDDFDES
jgi:hypothetical protein